MPLLDLLDQKFSKVEAVTIGVLLLCMSAIAFIQVIARYCFFTSFVWSEEISRYMMIWLTFIGSAYAVSKQDHINIDILSEYFKKHGFDVRVVLNVLILGFLIVCVFYGIKLVISTYTADQMTPAIGFPMFIVYLIVVISLIVAAFHALVRVIDFFAKKETSK